MTSDCPWRYLTADGRTVRCSGRYGEAHDDDHALYGLMVDHGWDDFPHIVGWEEDDPCAWSAVCPDCDGERGDPTPDGPWYPCGTCGGAGTVDTPPPRLIGVGSVLRGGPLDTRFVITSVDSDGVYYAVLPNGHRLTPIGPDDLADWTLVRAVPPAGDTT